MIKVEMTLETITPLFMGGRTTEVAEIRISSFKGVWRWWWRALGGGFEDYKQLKQQEDEIWGNTKRAGKVYFYLDNQQIKINYKFITRCYNLWYLWFTVAKYKNKKGETGLRQADEMQYVQSEQQFEVVLLSKDENALNEVLNSIWLATYLGGFGKRSRRGAGSLQAIDIKTNFTLGLDFFVKSDLEAWIEKNLNKAIKHKGFTKCKGWKIIDSIYVDSYSYYRWEDALDVVGEIYKEFRHNYRKEDRAVFGLPLPGVSGERWASPVIFKARRLPNGKFVPGVVFLKPECAQWLPASEVELSVLDEFKKTLEENDFQIAWQ